MIVLKVYVIGIATGKGKCQPPILIDLHSPRTGTVALQFMQSEVR